MGSPSWDVFKQRLDDVVPIQVQVEVDDLKKKNLVMHFRNTRHFSKIALSKLNP